MNIPAKEYNEMKGVMEDTSLPEWQEYYRQLEAHEEHYESIKPVREDFIWEAEYRAAYHNWSMNRACFEPNKPGYYRSNDD